MKSPIEVSSFIKEEMIIIEEHVTKDKAFDLLTASMNKSEHITDQIAFKKAILAREKQITTAIGHGLAIPHARLSSINDFVIGILVCKNGIDYETPDNEPVKLIFMIGASDQQDNNYIKLLSRLMLRLKDSNLINNIINLNNPNEIYELIMKAE